MKRRRHHLQQHRKSAVSTGSVKNEINVTPLVDVVLVLLIIFMVVTPMLSRGVKVEMPETAHHEKKQDTGQQIVVTVALDEKVYVETEMAEGEKLISELKLKLGKRGSDGIREVHVKADRRLEYGVVRKVLERIHAAGAPTVALGTEDRKKEGGK